MSEIRHNYECDHCNKVDDCIKVVDNYCDDFICLCYDCLIRHAAELQPHPAEIALARIVAKYKELEGGYWQPTLKNGCVNLRLEIKMKHLIDDASKLISPEIIASARREIESEVKS